MKNLFGHLLYCGIFAPFQRNGKKCKGWPGSNKLPGQPPANRNRNVIIESSDVICTDGLEYYAGVREALYKGRKNGKLLIENEMPKTIAGKRTVVDETFKDTALFKKSDEGEIKD